MHVSVARVYDDDSGAIVEYRVYDVDGNILGHYPTFDDVYDLFVDPNHAAVVSIFNEGE